jgi:hypothetical protein
MEAQVISKWRLLASWFILARNQILKLGAAECQAAVQVATIGGQSQRVRSNGRGTVGMVVGAAKADRILARL